MIESLLKYIYLKDMSEEEKRNYAIQKNYCMKLLKK